MSSSDPATGPRCTWTPSPGRTETTPSWSGCSSPTRDGCAVQLKRLSAAGLDTDAIVTGPPEELEQVITKTGADRLIVTSPDYTHAGLIVRGLDAGVDVVVEKPLTIDAGEHAADRRGRRADGSRGGRDPQLPLLAAQLAASSRSSKSNAIGDAALGDLRVGARHRARRRLLPPLAPGQDQLRRSADPQGIHHFDLVNWWLGDAPAQVYARGGVRFYGAENAADRGLATAAATAAPTTAAHDPFALDLRQ